MLLRLFKNWKNILKKKNAFLFLSMGLILLWITDNFFIGKIHYYNIIFLIISSLVLILVSINQMNWLIVNERINIIKNPIFIICCAIIIFFAYSIVTEVFYYYAPQQTIKKNVFTIQAYLNVLYNVLLFVAILCIKPKRIFIKQ